MITNSLFNHKEIHQFTWEDVSQNRKSIIDYVIVDKSLGKLVKDTRVFRSFEIGSDHYLVGSEIKLNKPKIIERKVKYSRIRVEKLANEDVKKKFSDMFREEFAKIEDLPEQSVEEEWIRYRDTMISVARKCLGVCSSKGGKNKTSWWNQDIKRAVKEKKQLLKNWLQKRNAESRQKYVECRKRVQLMIKEAKVQSWEDFGKDLDNLGNQANKKFWSTVNSFRKKKEVQTCIRSTTK